MLGFRLQGLGSIYLDAGSGSGMTKEGMDPQVEPEDDLGVKPYHFGLGLTRSVGFAFRGSSGQ